MAELVDALVSGTSSRKGVQVRFLFWAPQKSPVFLTKYRTFFYHVNGLSERLLFQFRSEFMMLGYI
jgi:hypothetical protein